MNSISDKKIERHSTAIKILHVMRFYLLFLIVSITQAFGSTLYSQSASLTLRMSNTTIEDVLNRIEEQTEFRFLYNKKIVDVEHKVNVSTKNGKITDVLDHLFKDAGIS